MNSGGRTLSRSLYLDPYVSTVSVFDRHCSNKGYSLIVGFRTVQRGTAIEWKIEESNSRNRDFRPSRGRYLDPSYSEYSGQVLVVQWETSGKVD